ncbi:dihydroneopterin aldolase [Rubellicoccus peritrichatus]|uniref:7,8-dihydroneopterin aldolase n=1 Tax=Rubellicoccus peritrichatus TaxID=3080537 RepID=A0AAQ3QV52_9BACT|nr:dihydroneopterin aldolase [Puniceicoccus sp. CR14]WOO41163.1 dihydroneopterin aldolase [Puniceicoccus sp. CR14]
MNKTKIELKNLAFFARHGLMKEEEALGQRFRLDVRVEIDPSLDLSADAPHITINYVELYALVKEIFEGKRFNLIESCADMIARSILEKFDKAIEVSVTIKKPSVPVDCICDYFATEVTRCR